MIATSPFTVMPAHNTITHTLILSLTLALAAGCAGKSPPPPVAAVENGAASGVSSPEGILALGERMRGNRLTTYSSSTTKYTYFIGGVLNAEYAPQTGVLVVSSLAAGESLSCKYGPDGVLFVDPKAKGNGESYTARCTALVTRLHQRLAR